MSGSWTSGGLDRLRAAMRGHVERQELPGLVTLVAEGDDVQVDEVGTKAFGSSEPMRRDTVFRITSMTKPMLAAVTMTLVEEGTIALDEPVDRLLPELADRRVLVRADGPLDETVAARRAVTVEDLLTFRMGHGLLLAPDQQPPINPPVPIVRAAEELELVLAEPDPRTPHPPDEWIRLFGTLPLMHQPGELWQYNTGAHVLSVLVARAAGLPLPEVFRERLFEPLGMATTGFSLPAEVTAALPSYYMTDFATGKVELRDVSRPDEWSRPPIFPTGAAGLLSTADDLLAFGRMLFEGGGRVLSAASVERMTRNVLTPEQIAGGGFLLSGLGWGYGMSVAVEPDDVSPTSGRYGWDGGYGTSWFNDPSTGRIGILLTQCSDVLFNGTIREFARLTIAA
jgi:CubicO group peptidase (beta-lactamase class C family)